MERINKRQYDDARTHFSVPALWYERKSWVMSRPAPDMS